MGQYKITLTEEEKGIFDGYDFYLRSGLRAITASGIHLRETYLSLLSFTKRD